MTDPPEHLDLSTLVCGKLDNADTLDAEAHLKVVRGVSGRIDQCRRRPLAPMAPPPLSSRRRRPVLIGLTAAAAVVVAGTALGIARPWADDAARPAVVAPTVAPEPEVTVASATLAPLDDSGDPAPEAERGTVTMTDGAARPGW